jgi:hypothetical protein
MCSDARLTRDVIGDPIHAAPIRTRPDTPSLFKHFLASYRPSDVFRRHHFAPFAWRVGSGQPDQRHAHAMGQITFKELTVLGFWRRGCVYFICFQGVY